MPRKVDRLRIIAGPNGSGKSTIIDKLRQSFDCGIYLNTDEIEKVLRDKNFLNLSDYLLETSQEQFKEFLQKEGVQSLVAKAQAENAVINLHFEENILLTSGQTSSYEAALAGEFIKEQLLLQHELFTFELVMSYPSKLDFIKAAKEHGYHIYLYFIATESVEINIGRVEQHVLKMGHNVTEDRIRSRYEKTMKLLSYIIPLTYRTFLFDNSFENIPLRLVAEIYKGKDLTIHTNNVPGWVYQYVLEPMKYV
jgi:predicted ABC-type ATPase